MLTSSHVVDLERSICRWSYAEISQIKRSIHAKNGKWAHLGTVQLDVFQLPLSGKKGHRFWLLTALLTCFAFRGSSLLERQNSNPPFRRTDSKKTSLGCHFFDDTVSSSS